MLLRDKIRLSAALLKARLNKGEFFPLAVSWSLTRRCNYRCKYCNEWNYPCGELNSREIFRVMDELKSMGTRIIGLDGGEPLLRDDIGEIIDYAKRKDFFVSINTNGYFIKEKFTQIKKADLINISFDGPEEAQDYLRGEGSYAAVMDAAELIKSHNIALKFNCTILKYNLSHIDFVLDKALELKVKVRFEPISDAHLKDGEEILSSMCPSATEYKEAIQKIKRAKRNNKYVLHSDWTLEYLLNWPFIKEIDCFSGKFICRIEPNGDIYPCTMTRTAASNNCLESGFKYAFESLAKVNCGRCWCLGTLEFNHLLSVDFKDVKSLMDLFL